MDITIEEAKNIYITHVVMCPCGICRIIRKAIKELDELETTKLNEKV